MKIRTVSAEVKLSKNFQTYGVGMSADLDGEDEQAMIRMLQAMCRKLATEQMHIDNPKAK